MAIPVLAELFSQYELTEINRLVLFLVFEKNVNPNSFWFAYLNLKILLKNYFLSKKKKNLGNLILIFFQQNFLQHHILLSKN